MSFPYTEYGEAQNFMAGIELGVDDWSGVPRHETLFGPSTGMVYIIAIGEPYITHVKVGFTRGNPYARMRDLQTGCPYSMRMIGFMFGTVDRERELHDALSDERAQGEWFVYTNYVQNVISDTLNAEPAYS